MADVRQSVSWRAPPFESISCSLIYVVSQDSIPTISIPLHTLIELTPKPDGTMSVEYIPVNVDKRPAGKVSAQPAAAADIPASAPPSAPRPLVHSASQPTLSSEGLHYSTPGRLNQTQQAPADASARVIDISTTAAVPASILRGDSVSKGSAEGAKAGVQGKDCKVEAHASAKYAVDTLRDSDSCGLAPHDRSDNAFAAAV